MNKITIFINSPLEQFEVSSENSEKLVKIVKS